MQPLHTASDVWCFLHNRGLHVTPLDVGGFQLEERTQTLFWLGDRPYLIPNSHVIHIQPFIGCEPVPFAQPYVVGTAQVHGHDVIILDIRPLLLQECWPPEPGAILLIVQLENTEIALLADRVEPAGTDVSM